MIEQFIKKINSYKSQISKKSNSLYLNSFEATKDIVEQSKDRIEIEKIKISLKKYYYYLGKYVAKQYISKGYSDFSLDEQFKILNDKIKNILNDYNKIKNNQNHK